MTTLDPSIPRTADSRAIWLPPMACLAHWRDRLGDVFVLDETGPLLSRSRDCTGVVAAFGANNHRTALTDIERFSLPNSDAQHHPMRSDLVRQQTAPLLLQWILAHELGHVLLGHTGTHYFADPLKVERSTRREDHLMESATDDYAASRLFGAGGPEGMQVLLVDLASAEVVAQTGTPLVGVGILYDYAKPVHFTQQCSHPAYVVRATRLLARAVELRNEPGLKAMLSSFANVLREDQGSNAEGGMLEVKPFSRRLHPSTAEVALKFPSL